MNVVGGVNEAGTVPNVPAADCVIVLPPFAAACRRVVARFGAVSSFSYKGVALTAEQIAACNA